MSEPKRILVAEDDDLLAKFLGLLLSRAGYEVSHASNGNQVLEALDDRRPAGIILDCMMPGINGFEVLRAIKNNPETANIPVLMLSGKGLEQDIIGGLSLGADEYVVKPFAPDDLLARLKSLLPRTG